MLESATRKVVIAGNPNTGKTTLFNLLTGGRAKVGNYPGITVSRHQGRIRLPGLGHVELVDSPGTYSLSARSADEQIALSAILGNRPTETRDLVIAVVDATQLSRNLYLVLQLIELNLPVVVALNMTDMLERAGQSVDIAELERALGVPVVATTARKGLGIEQLGLAISRVLDDPELGRPGWRWEPEEAGLLEDIAAVGLEIPDSWHRDGPAQRQALALWALLSLDDDDELREVPDALRRVVRQRRSAAANDGRNIDREVIEGRYRWIDAHCATFLHTRDAVVSVTDRIDRVLLHPLLGFFLFLGLMTLVFQSLFTWADPLIGLIESGIGWVQGQVSQLLPDGLPLDLLNDGIIGGVGAFLVFLPQILLLFLFISIMEDTGYMARVAVLMDRIMKAVGLHGRAFVPMLSGFACAVPALMATRNMERHRDRLLTMMVVPLMTCSARLPVYGLLIAAIVPPSDDAPFAQGLLLAAMYLFGTVTALVCAFVLGRTMLRAVPIPLLIELPPYRMPHWPSVVMMMWSQAKAFVIRAGSIILVCSIAMWALLAFPRDPELDVDYAGQMASLDSQLARPDLDPALAERLTGELAQLERAESGARIRQSIAGTLGRVIEPLIEPLGFDWKIGVGVISAFAAREVFVSTMGVVYGMGEVDDDGIPALRERLGRATWPDGRKVFTPLACLSLMIFFALACQCLSTLAVARQETGSWWWPVFMFVYMSVLAWAASFTVFQGGRLLGFS